MLDIKEIQRRLADRNLAAVAREVGCTRTYLHYVAKGKQEPSENGRIRKALSDYLEVNL